LGGKVKKLVLLLLLVMVTGCCHHPLGLWRSESTLYELQWSFENQHIYWGRAVISYDSVWTIVGEPEVGLAVIRGDTLNLYIDKELKYSLLVKNEKYIQIYPEYMLLTGSWINREDSPMGK